MSKSVTPKTCGFSCSECAARNCFHKDTKYPAFCLTKRYADAAAKTKELYGSDGVDAKLARATKWLAIVFVVLTLLLNILA